jgi:hypothetical protein
MRALKRVPPSHGRVLSVVLKLLREGIFGELVMEELLTSGVSIGYRGVCQERLILFMAMLFIEL